jgi:hypothetical protein
MSEIKDNYLSTFTNLVSRAAERTYDSVIYKALDATFQERAKYDDGRAPKTHTFENDGCEQIDFTTGSKTFNYVNFCKMIERFEAKDFDFGGIAFVCSEVERAALEDDLVTNDQYRRNSGAVFDSRGRLEYLRGVKIIKFGSGPAEGSKIVKTSGGKRKCFMFNTNEGGTKSAITYDNISVRTSVIKLPDEIDVNMSSFVIEAGACRCSSAFVIKALTVETPTTTTE